MDIGQEVMAPGGSSSNPAMTRAMIKMTTMVTVDIYCAPATILSLTGVFPHESGKLSPPILEVGKPRPRGVGLLVQGSSQ